jgi:DNA repair exonuclease SbcCD nuclease subunit
MVFVIAGNHDPMSEQRNELFNLPPNVRLFGSDMPEAKIVKNKNSIEIARVIGQSYKYREESRKMHFDYSVPNDGLCNIALLHTQLDTSNSSYVPCSLSELKSVKNVHYWALGHIHKSGILNKSDPAVAYSGVPQGRDIGETGQGSFLLVDMDGTRVLSMENVPVSPVIWKSIEVNLKEADKIENLTDLEEKILVMANDMADFRLPAETGKTEGYIAEWVIRGKSDLYGLIAERIDEAAAELTEKLNKTLAGRKPFIFTERIKILTQKVQSDEDIRKKPMYSEIVRIASEYSENDAKKNSLKEKLKNIWEFNKDPESISETKLQMSEELYYEILERAKMLILEKLPEGSENQ